MQESHIHSSLTRVDESFETTLRPAHMEEFIGQEALQKRLHIYIGAAKKRHEALGHSLFSGPPGLGKTTLANIIAKTMGTQLVVTSGPVLEKPSDLAGLLTNLQKGDILFIDEIHRIPKQIEEYLYSAMEDFSLDLLIDSGPSARSVQIKLNPFTLVGATTRLGLLSNPLRSRFLFTARLDYYPAPPLCKIIHRSAKILGIPIETTGATSIAQRARGTPRIANNLICWVRDFAQMHQKMTIDSVTALEALTMLNIDDQGLDEMDKKILDTLYHLFDGGPVGLKSLAVAVGEEPQTIADVHEPFLILQGFIKRTLRGRELTVKAYRHLGLKPSPKHQGENTYEES